MAKRDPTGPNESTKKRLFADSGRRCAFPGCTAALFEEEALVGDICHIKAANSRGPRYDPQQTPAERRSYDNLIVLCKNHHAVIDNDAKKYTVECLQRMKAEHKKSEAPIIDETFASQAACRVEIINKLYQHLCNARDWFQRAVTITQCEGYPPREECRRRCKKEAASAQETLAKGRLLIPSESANECDRFLRKLAHGLLEFSLAQDRGTPDGPQREALWQKANNTATKIEMILDNIEKGFRTLMH